MIKNNEGSLYGDDKVINELMEDISEVEKSQNFKVVFGSTIGSISKGIHRSDSDYDLRMLYVWNDGMLDKRDYHLIRRIRYREFFSAKIYDCIPFWEIGAFLNFLCEPYIDSGYKFHLVRNVLWSFYSDYKYDPYHITPMVQEVLKHSVDLELERDYHCDVIHDIMHKMEAGVDREYSRKVLKNL